MNQKDLIEIGYIKKIWGIKGEVECFLDVDYPKKYKNITHLLIENNREIINIKVEKIEIRKNEKIYLKLYGYDSIEDSKTLVKKKIFLSPEALPKRESQSYYFHDLIDMEVYEMEKHIGTVDKIYTDYLHDRHFLQIKENILIPIMDVFILSVNKESKEIHVKLPDNYLQAF